MCRILGIWDMDWLEGKGLINGGIFVDTFN
jgi:hypothetical protein